MKYEDFATFLLIILFMFLVDKFDCFGAIIFTVLIMAILNYIFSWFM